MTAHIFIPRSHPTFSFRTRAARACMYIYTYRDILHSRTVRPVLRAKQRPTFRTQRKLADGGLSSQRSLPRFFVFFFLFLALSLSFFLIAEVFRKSTRRRNLRIDVYAPDSYQPGISRIRDGKRNDTDCST